jgi:DNA replication ATP-dependent helicase Dna2
MASLFADLDASIFDEQLSPVSSKRASPQSSQVALKVRSRQSSLHKQLSFSRASSIKLSQSPSPTKKAYKKARRVESLPTWRDSDRADEIKAATEHLLQHADDWMHDLLSPSPKRAKVVKRKGDEVASSSGKEIEHSVSPTSLLIKKDIGKENSRRYTRCLIDEVVETHYIPKRYLTAPANHYTTKGVRPETVTSAMQRRQKVLYLYELEKLDSSSSQESQNGKQKQGKRCRVKLRDEWLSTPTRPGDIVHLIGEWKEEPDERLEQKDKQRIEIDLDDPDEALWSEMQDMPTSSQMKSPTMIPTMTLGSNAQSIDQYQEETGRSLIDNLLILHPDVLLSATAVSTVIRCTRRSYLQSKVKVSGPSGEDAPNESLLMGKMLHEVLQSCLTGRPKLPRQDFTPVKGAAKDDRQDSPFPIVWRGPKPTNFSSAFVKEQIESQVQCSLEDILSAGLDTDSAADKLWEAAASFGQFASSYLVPGEDGLPQKDALAVDARSPVSPLVRVVQVLDVEEDIWSPMYGLKGFVDVSVEVEIVDGCENMVKTAAASKKGDKTPQLKRRTYVMPLELKTGRSIDKIQHQAQTMLYMLMMSDRYHQPIDQGLLYYSKTSTLHLIRSVQKEVRALLLARNELADYLSRRPDAGKERGELPPIIDNERDCGRCYAVDECMLYRRAVEGVCPEGDISPIASLYQAKVSHMTDQHAAFFKHWEHLLTMEEDDIVRFRRQLWTMTAAAREKDGRCLSNMVLTPRAGGEDGTDQQARSASGMNERIVYKMTKNDLSSVHLGGVFAVGDPISVSIEPDFYSVAQGHLLDLSSNIVTVAVDRDLLSLVERIKHSKPIFRIDKEEFASGMAKVRYNLARLFFEAPLGDVRRRELIVDLKEPRFSERNEGKPHLTANDMNEDQRQAVEKVLIAEDYALIVGMPGTGKTTIIVGFGSVCREGFSTDRSVFA